MKKNYNFKKLNTRAFTILEIVITIVFIVIVTAPILNTFQLTERLGEKSRRGFIAQNLAREMMSEISQKNFSDPDELDTFETGLKPGPTHEEYLPDSLTQKIANGTNEITGQPEYINETLVNRARYFDDIDDYDGYNTDENILPTDTRGREHLFEGENINKSFRVKVRVLNDVSFMGEPLQVLDTAETLSAPSMVMAATRDSKYLLMTDPATNLTDVYNTKTGTKIDNQPNEIAPYAYGDGENTPGSDPISLRDLRETPFEMDNIDQVPISHFYKLGGASKTITGPAGDRFYTLHRAALNDFENYSAVSAIDMNPHGTPEVSFHKLDDINLVARDLRSNSINAITVDSDYNVYAATNGAGLMKSDDNGESWSPVAFYQSDGVKPVLKVNCLASTRYKERFLNRSVVLAGADGGLLVIEKSSKKKYRDAAISDAQNVTALALAENGYSAVGLDDGSVYISKNFAMEYGKNSSSLVKKTGPVEGKKVNALAIDDNFRLWLGNDDGQYYSDDAFGSLTDAGCSWKLFTSEAQVNAIYIDRSRTMPAPFIPILERAATGITCSPSLLADERGLHLFYLDDSTDGANGETLANTKLWYAHSSDFGKSWQNPIQVCHTPSGKAAWAHSEVIDKNGTLHAMWQSYIYKTEWNIFYQRSEDCGQKWLSDDKCAFNQYGEKPLHSYNFKNGAESDWVKYGSEKLSRLAVSANNTLYGVASAGDMSQYHYSFLSPSCGQNWNSDYVMSVFKPSDMASGYVESINILNAKNKLINVATYGEKYTGRIFFEAELYARTVNVNVNSFGLYDVVDSAPAAFNDENVFLYCYSQKDYSGEVSLNAIYSYYPYSQFNNTKLHITPDRIFRPQMHKNDAYLFFSTKSDASISGAGNITGRLFMARSDDSGINYSSPIFIDYIYGTYDQPASAKYNSKVYLVKKTIDKSPGSNFALSSIPSQLMMCGAGSSAFSFDCDMAPVNKTDLYRLDETVTAFSGDDEGNMLCATTNGLYIRNVKNANAILNYSTYGAEYKKGFVLFPLSLTGHEKFSDPLLPRLGWQKLFSGMHITSAYAEKSGNYWIATLKNGIYRSVDFGRSWTHIESRMSNIVDINYVSAGRAPAMNKLNLVTRRYNVNGAERKIVLETLFLIYDLASNVIESSSLLASEDVKNPDSADGDASCSAVNSADNSKIFYFNPQDSCIYYKKPDLSSRTALQAFSAYSVNENYNKLQVEAEKDDRLELIVSGKFKGLDGKYCFIPSAIANVNFYSDAASINSLQLKINDEESDFNHYYFKDQPLAAAPYVRIKNYIESSAEGEKSYIYEANYNVDAKVIKASKKLVQDPIEGVTGLFCGPDEDTLYALCRSKNKVYAISGIKEMNDVKISEYSTGLENPVSVLFPPFSSGSRAKAYITCKNNIFETNGSSLISSASSYDIADSLLTDGNVLLFYDSLSRKVYKCPRASQKNVFVSVIDKDEGAAISISPVNISKKFYSFNYNSPAQAARKYIKYNYIYTSRDYPAGIRPETPQHWTIGSDSDETAVNVYVIDSNFEVNGELTIQTGVALKFATADKRKYPTDFSGRSDAVLKCIGGRLIISGDTNNKVLFTSLDDVSVPPSVYNAPDTVFETESGLPNLQMRMAKYEAPYYQEIGGVRYADWGVSDGTPGGSPGGVYILNGMDSSFMLNHARARYALLYSQSLYGYDLLPFNINDYETIWDKTNVYVLSNDAKTLLKNAGSLKITQGAIIKIDTNSSLTIEGKHDTIFPHCTFIVDGSPYAPAHFQPLSEIGLKEGKTPRAAVIQDWYKIIFDGTAEIASIRKAEFKSFGTISHIGSLASFNGCEITGMILGSTAKSTFSLNQNASIKVDNSLFSLYYPAEVNVHTTSTANFSRNDFNISYNTGQGAEEESFIMTRNPPATLILNANNFYDGYFSAGNRTNRFNGSKISFNSVAYINNNFFLNSDQPVPPAGGTSCEIYIADSPFVSDALTGVWPEISGNYFLNNQLPVYISGFNDPAPFVNKIKNNYFINSAALVNLNNNSMDSAGVSRFVDPGKAALDNDGRLYIIDRKSGSYYKFNSNGEILMRVGARGMGNGEFNDASAIAVNLTGEVYVIDSGNKRIQKFDKYGNFINKFNVFGEGKGKLKNPTAISTVTLNNSEVILVTDKDRNRVLKFSNEGEFIEEIGDGADGLNAPVDIAASPDQKFAYVADSRNNRIIKVQLNIDEYKTERFDAALKVYSTVSSETSGFTAGDSCEEGEYFEINVTAKNSDGNTNIDYKPFSGGKIITDFTGGVIRWEGTGITDNSASASDNGATFNESAFTKGSAKFYARCSASAGHIKIFIFDNVNSKLKTGAVLKCVPENVPWGLNFIGTNPEGFRRYSAANDPEVKFIKIPGANFISGNENAGGTYTEVKMSPYYIAETLTTNAQFNRWRRHSSNPPPLQGSWSWQNSGSAGPGSDSGNYPDHPAVFISYDDAKNYCHWLIRGSNKDQSDSYIPTEAQYEKAGRGPNLAGLKNSFEEKRYPWGNFFSSDSLNSASGNTSDERKISGRAGTTPVNKYRPQGYYGLYDIAGNLNTWCRDWYGDTYPAARIDPCNAVPRPLKAVRGGSWNADSFSCMTSSRHGASPMFYAHDDVGIRPCVSPIK